jgi:hypothetical protein
MKRATSDSAVDATPRHRRCETPGTRCGDERRHHRPGVPTTNTIERTMTPKAVSTWARALFARTSRMGSGMRHHPCRRSHGAPAGPGRCEKTACAARDGCDDGASASAMDVSATRRDVRLTRATKNDHCDDFATDSIFNWLLASMPRPGLFQRRSLRQGTTAVLRRCLLGLQTAEYA